MKNVTKTFVLMSAVVLVGLIPATTASAVSPPPTQYVALGDSFAQGIGSPVPEQTGWVSQVENRYFHGAYAGSDKTLNLATDQVDTTTSTLITDGQLASAVAAIVDPNTDTRLVTLTVGGNDLLRLLRSGPCSTDPASATCQGLVVAAITGVAANYPVILGTLVGATGGEPDGTTIVVTTYYNPFDGTGSPFEGAVEFALLGLDGVIDCAATVANPHNAGLNDVIACTAGAFGVAVVDLHPLFEGRTLELTHIGANDVHPNSKGHRIIADAVIDAAS